MSPSEVSKRFVIPLPGPAVPVQTTFAPSKRSLVFLVVTVPLLLVVLSPVAAALTSTGVTVSFITR